MSHSTPPTVGWYTTSEAMTRLGCSEATLKRRINTGELQAKTENRRRLILLPISTDNATALVAVEQSAMFAQLLAAEREALQLTRQTCAAVAESSRRACVRLAGCRGAVAVCVGCRRGDDDQRRPPTRKRDPARIPTCAGSRSVALFG